MTARLAALAVLLAAAACARPLAGENSDSAVRARVLAALAGRPELELRYVSVDVTNGTVTLSGLVPNPAHRVEIEHLVSRVSGVESVLDNLAVQE